MKRALLLCACLAAGLSLFAVGGVAGAADGLTTTTTPAATTSAAPPTSSSSTTVATTTAPAATTTAPPPSTTAAAATTSTTTTVATTTPTTTSLATTTTTPAATTTTPASSGPAPGSIAWWIQLLGNRGRGPQAPAPTTPPAKTTTTAGSAKSSGTAVPATAAATAAAGSAEAAAAPEIVQPPAPARLVVTARATQGDLSVGSTVTVTVTVQNTGGRPVAALLTEELPDALAPIYVEADQGTCDGETSIRCAVGSVGPGRSIDVVLVAQVIAATSFTLDAIVVAADDGVTIDGPPTLRFKAAAAAAVRLALPK